MSNYDLIYAILFGIAIAYGIFIRLVIAALRKKTRLFERPIFHLTPFAGWAVGVVFNVASIGLFLALVALVSSLFPVLGLLNTFLTRGTILFIAVWAFIVNPLVEFSPRQKTPEPGDWLLWNKPAEEK
ncbi:MAG TPA: hypothetical protein VGI19_19230 [Candidatus Cybelea sp.]|jgi:hypothetical protein